MNRLPAFNTTDEDELRKIYSEVDLPVKKLMELWYGKEMFNQKITDRIKTFDDALQWREQSRCVLGQLDELEKRLLFDYKGSSKRILSQQAHLKLTIIAEALNEGWFPDWANHNEYKYYPWFKYTSGVGCSFCGSIGGYAVTGYGSRLCFKSRELAEYAGKQFQDIYNNCLN